MILHATIVLALVAASECSWFTDVFEPCCNEPAFKIYHRCTPVSNRDYAEIAMGFPTSDSTAEFYTFSPSEGTDNTCSTAFCQDGYRSGPYPDNCGLKCSFIGCNCNKCRTNDGVNLDNIKNAYLKQFGFKYVYKSATGQVTPLNL